MLRRGSLVAFAARAAFRLIPLPVLIAVSLPALALMFFPLGVLLSLIGPVCAPSRRPAGGSAAHD